MNSHPNKASYASPQPANDPRMMFVLWRAPGRYRSETLASALGAEAVHVYWDAAARGRRTLPLRYLWQMRETWRVLRAGRPQVVLVQTPPFLLTLLVWAYTRRFGGVYITDNHSSTFDDRRWQAFHVFDRFLSRRALMNLAHNHKNLETLEAWGARGAMVVLSPARPRAELLPEPMTLPPEIESALGKYATHVLFVNRFATDDCWREVLGAAERMPEAAFYFTGDHTQATQDWSAAPANVVLTGFLPQPVFLALMDRCDVVLTLTKRPNTLLWSIREAIALEKPFVATDNEVTRHNFSAYGLFTDNSPEDLAQKIGEALECRGELVSSMAGYVARDQERWGRDVDEIRGRIAQSDRL